MVSWKPEPDLSAWDVPHRLGHVDGEACAAQICIVTVVGLGREHLHHSKHADMLSSCP